MQRRRGEGLEHQFYAHAKGTWPIGGLGWRGWNTFYPINIEHCIDKTLEIKKEGLGPKLVVQYTLQGSKRSEMIKFRDDVIGIGSVLLSHHQTPLDESQ